MALALEEPETIWELKKRAERYIQREEVVGATRNRGGNRDNERSDGSGEGKRMQRANTDGL